MKKLGKIISNHSSHTKVMMVSYCGLLLACFAALAASNVSHGATAGAGVTTAVDATITRTAVDAIITRTAVDATITVSAAKKLHTVNPLYMGCHSDSGFGTLRRIAPSHPHGKQRQCTREVLCNSFLTGVLQYRAAHSIIFLFRLICSSFSIFCFKCFVSSNLVVRQF